jgi:signal transduction histidine kinase
MLPGEGHESPSAEAHRLFALRRYGVLDTPPEEAFDRLAELAAAVVGAPIGLISLVDADRQWHKAAHGTDIRAVPREHSFCAHAIETPGPMVQEDLTQDDRFAENPYVAGRSAEAPLRFYAGAPLVSPEGYRLGTVCALDVTPHAPSGDAVRHLEYLADLVVDRLEERLRWDAARGRVSGQIDDAVQQYQMALRHAPVAFARTDRDLRYEWAYNAYTDFAPDAMEGKRDDEIDAGPGVRQLMHLKRRVLARGEHQRQEVTFERPSGAVTYDITATPICEEGRVVGVLTAALDVTDRKRTEQALEQATTEVQEAKRMKTALLANVNHEFRTPLTSIISFSRLIEETPALAADFAGRILNGGQRLLHTLNTVMDFAALEGGEMAPTPQLLDLREAAAVVAEAFEDEAGRQALSLATDLPDTPVSALLDAHHVERIATHLTSNALKFTEEGTVTIGVAQEGEAACLWVRDTGIGIPPEARPDIFDAFRQASAGYDRTHEGNGLGLTVARRLAEQMDGTIQVTSTPGEGTRVTVRFPTAAPE